MWGKGLTQDELMIRDECILLTENDEIIGHASKLLSHTFDTCNPKGLLHRAFSVFLFNEDGKLLLQKRAKDKITFPSVWTNTCCSHPLYGFIPSEVDDFESVSQGQVSGIKNAAIRKLEHELGIKSNSFTHDDIKYITRFHYCSVDSLTNDYQACWGEHEIDYILLIKKNITINVNPDEISDTVYVDFSELSEMMKPDNGLLWSPWFRIIVNNFLVHWWNDLDRAIYTDAYNDYTTIHRFSPLAQNQNENDEVTTLNDNK